MDRDPDALLRDTRGRVVLPPGVRTTVIGARVTAGPLGRWLGDLLVRLDSATGRHRRRDLGFEGPIELTGLHHFSLLNHPDVYERLREVLSSGTDGPVAGAAGAGAAPGNGR